MSERYYPHRTGAMRTSQNSVNRHFRVGTSTAGKEDIRRIIQEHTSRQYSTSRRPKMSEKSEAMMALYKAANELSASLV